MKKIPALFGLILSSALVVGCNSQPAVEIDSGTGENPAAGTVEAMQGEYVTILTPAAGSTVSSPFNVTGTTDYPNATLHLESYDSNGEINNEAKWHTEADGSFDFGDTYYFVGGGAEGHVDVVLFDADGKEIDRAIVNVMFE